MLDKIKNLFQRKDISDVNVCLAYKYFGTTLDEYPFKEYDGLTVDKLLKQRFPDIPEKVIWRAMERSDKKGYVDYGTNLRSGWLTEEGEAFLDDVLQDRRNQ